MTQTKRGRKPETPTHTGTGRTCRECCRGAWNMSNFNYKGKPFMIYCEHGERGYSHVDKLNVTYEDCAACENFKAGDRTSRKIKGGNI